ncbi:MAG: hypothetical protein RL141_658 [Candidatus Parcubacteria bacterium]|jgi:asparagine synthase (glutamine-hydrolysing)
MCGLAGFVGPEDQTLMRLMGERIRHRGPDQDGEFVSKNCSLIHRRLSIIDLSEAGRQPLSTADGRFTIVYNGEIYNYRALRKAYEAEGYVFRTQTDTECLLASMALHELRDLESFHGMFAFVLWDVVAQVAYAARDRMGIKPLYAASVDGRTAFASEIPALLPLRARWEQDLVARATYFSVGYVPGPRTMYQGIQALDPGCLYTITNESISFVSRFDHPEPATRQPETISWNDALSQLPSVVDQAVERQLVSDRPVGVFLSGGLDSTVVLSAMRAAQPSAKINTFTTRFRHHTEDPKFNRDATLARETAQKYGCEHQEVEVGAEDVIREAEAMARHLGQPHANHSVVALDAAARLAAQRVPVVLSGDGGDESFGGYDRYRLYARTAAFLAHPAGRRVASLVAKLHPHGDRWADFLQADTEAARLLSFHAPSLAVRRSLFGEAVVNDATVIHDWQQILDAASSLESPDPAARFMALDRQGWLRDDAFVRADRLTMRHGVELRVPLTDDAVVAFAASLPGRYHADAWQVKKLWRTAFASRCLPAVVAEPKRGWFPPTAKWIRVGLTDWVRSLLIEAAADHPWINGEALQQALNDHLAGRAYRLNEIWLAVSYQLWWREAKHSFV